MNLHHLQLFAWIAESGSVTAGAERAAISQPAVSRALAELESALHQRLVHRGPKGITLTPAGEVLSHYARQIFDLEAEAEGAMADLRGLRAGRLTVGASTTIGDYLLASPVSRFVTQHPGIEFQLEIGNTEAVVAGVMEGRYDVGFTEGEVQGDRLSIEQVLEDELIVFGPRNHPAVSAPSSIESVLFSYPIVLREPGSGTRRIVEDRLRLAGIVPNVVCTLGSTALIKSAVVSGVGLGIASRLALQAEFAAGILFPIQSRVRFPRHLQKIRLAWRSESAALNRFQQVLNQHLQTISPRDAA